MKSKGIQSMWLSEKLGVSSPVINDYYRSDNPRRDTKAKILKALGITEDYLYNFGNEVQEEEAVYNVVEKEDDYIKITPSQLTYLLEAVKERDDLKNARIKELEEKSRG